MCGLPKERRQLDPFRAIGSANTQTRTAALPRGGIYVKTAGKRDTTGKADIRNPQREDAANPPLRAGDSLRVKE